MSRASEHKVRNRSPELARSEGLGTPSLQVRSLALYRLWTLLGRNPHTARRTASMFDPGSVKVSSG